MDPLARTPRSQLIECSPPHRGRCIAALRLVKRPFQKKVSPYNTHAMRVEPAVAVLLEVLAMSPDFDAPEKLARALQLGEEAEAAILAIAEANPPEERKTRSGGYLDRSRRDQAVRAFVLARLGEE